MPEPTEKKITSRLVFDTADEELKAVKDLLSTVLAAVKNYGLFPEEHATTKKVLATVQVAFHKFLRHYGTLRLYVGNDHFIFNDEIVYQTPVSSENLAYILFRDGIVWLEFQENLEVRELTQFFRIINQFKQPLEEPEEDLVTALWSANFPHIVHEAADVFWKAEPIIEFSLLKSKGPRMASDFDTGIWGIEGPWMDGVPGAGGGVPGPKGGSGFGPGQGGGPGLGSGSGSGPGFGSGPGQGSGPGSGTGPGSGGFGQEDGSTQPGLGFGPGEGGGMGAGPGWGPGNEGMPGFGPGSGPGAGPGTSGVPGLGAGYGPGEGGGAGLGPGADGPGLGAGAGPGWGPGTSGHPGAGPGAGAGLGPGLGPGAGGGSGDSGIDDYRATSSYNESIAVTINTPGTGRALWELTPDEEESIKRLVSEEENRDNTKDVIDVLMIVLKQEKDQQQFATTLFFLLEEFRSTLELMDFRYAIELVKNIKQLSETCKSDRPWAEKFFTDFFNDITTSDILDVLVPLCPKLAGLPTEQLKLFSQVLLLLPTKASLTLAEMLHDIKVERIRLLMIDIINYMASRDFVSLETLLSARDPQLVQKLVKTLGKIDDGKVDSLLLDRMLRHGSDEVRLEALNALIVRENSQYERLLPLVNDPSDKIRQQILLYFGQYKNPKVEELLLQFLTARQVENQDSQSLLLYYRALGLCASTNSLPFLKKTLLGKPWNFLFGTGSLTHRQGAAVALSLLKTDGSRAVLKRASNSIFPHIKTACRKALEK